MRRTDQVEAHNVDDNHCIRLEWGWTNGNIIGCKIGDLKVCVDLRDGTENGDDVYCRSKLILTSKQVEKMRILITPSILIIN